MFESKKTSLFSVRAKPAATAVAKRPGKKSAFVNAGLQNQAITTSGNSAKKYSTTGNPFVDQFGKVAAYKEQRKFSDIEKDCEAQWAENPLLTVVFIIYLRMITRVVQLFNGVSTSISQKGAEMRHEGIMRMIWLSQKAPKTFMKNVGIFVSVGSWKDIITMLQYDLVYHGWDNKVLNWNEIGDLIRSGLSQENTSELVKKYLPQIKANNSCRTAEAQADNMIAKWICSLIYGVKGNEKANSATYKAYRKMKSSGTAHQWQQLISQRKFNMIDFNKIHGRALNKLVRSKFLKNQNLTDVYAKWIGKDTTVAKYTGFVHELFVKLGYSLVAIPQHEQDTINKQFETAVNKAKDVETETKFIVVRDTSGSMASAATGAKEMSSGNIAKAIALYFSAFLEGAFKDSWIEFSSDAEMRQWKGNTPLEKWFNDRSSYNGSTNFLDVIHLFTRIKRQGVAEKDFPTGIICISDGNFDPALLGRTNVDSARAILRSAGFSEKFCKNFVICLWDIPNNYYHGKPKQNFETFGDVPNVFYMSGYSASVVSFLMTGKASNADDLFKEAMNQEVLNLVEL